MQQSRKGRGALTNPDCRFDSVQHQAYDDGWGPGDTEAPLLKTTVTFDDTRRIISTNQSPDLPFDQSINPYRGCEHGCIYCYARPSHAYLGFSPGLDFESQLLAKPNAAQLLRKELKRKTYRCRTIAMGTNTDPYQPIERKLQITREVLEVLLAFHHPVSIVTKSSLVERDLDILIEMAKQQLVVVMISISTYERELARCLEPRAAAPQRRLETLRRLSEASIPTGVLVAPVIPVLTDTEIESILCLCAEAGATMASYVLLRLPLEVRELFEEWLKCHFPTKAKHVMSRIYDTRGGQANESAFGKRMRGQGEYASMIAQRFRLSCRRLALNQRHILLDTNRFQVPIESGQQLDMF